MPDLHEQLFALYREALPANERRTDADLRSALGTSAYQLLTKERDGELIGFAILFVPPDRPFALLEYLAVQSRARGAGIGSELVMDAIKQTRGRHLLAEIESRSSDPTPARRQQFYHRHGFRRIEGLHYQLPLPGDPPPMELWIYPPPPEPITCDDLHLWVTTLYTEVYQCSSDDPRIARMLATQRACRTSEI